MNGKENGRVLSRGETYQLEDNTELLVISDHVSAALIRFHNVFINSIPHVFDFPHRVPFLCDPCTSALNPTQPCPYVMID
jgi:hypothetical protein